MIKLHKRLQVECVVVIAVLVAVSWICNSCCCWSMSKNPPSGSTRSEQKDPLGGSREVGDQAVWSLSSCKPGELSFEDTFTLRLEHWTNYCKMLNVFFVVISLSITQLSKKVLERDSRNLEQWQRWNRCLNWLRADYRSGERIRYCYVNTKQHRALKYSQGHKYPVVG